MKTLRGGLNSEKEEKTRKISSTTRRGFSLGLRTRKPLECVTIIELQRIRVGRCGRLLPVGLRGKGTSRKTLEREEKKVGQKLVFGGLFDIPSLPWANIRVGE